MSYFLCMVWDICPVLFFSMWLSSFPSSIYWTDCPVSVVYSCLLCCELIDHICLGLLFLGKLFLGLLFHSVDILIFFFFSNSILFWLLELCNIVSSQGTWYLQLYSFLSWWLWFLQFHTNFRIICPSSVKKMPLEFW